MSAVPHKFAAVLPAGGLGKRMGGPLPKQLLPLRGKPVYRYSLETFLRLPEIAEVVLAVPADWKSRFLEELAPGCGIPDDELLKLRIVTGGADRWQSVRNGVNALAHSDFVLIHDVARPFLSEALVREVFRTLESRGACLVAKPCADTVKVVEENGTVRETLDRNGIWLAQTPQACRVDLLKSLYMKMDAHPLDFTPTDEASILEHFQIPVSIVRGSAENDKITTPEDFARFSK